MLRDNHYYGCSYLLYESRNDEQNRHNPQLTVARLRSQNLGERDYHLDVSALPEIRTRLLSHAQFVLHKALKSAP
jgi:hypothetical protein